MRRVVMIGLGAIGRETAKLLAPEMARGEVSLTAVVRDAGKHAEHRGLVSELLRIEDTDPARLAETADLVVECAGVPAAGEIGPAVIAAGTPLVLTSVGALADAEVRRGLLAGPGRLHVTNGAIGGLDVLEAAAQAGALAEVALTTAKAPAGLIQPWMSEVEIAHLRALTPADGPSTIFTGHPAEAIAKFPANVNIAVALAWATRGLAGAATGPARAATGPARAIRGPAGAAEAGGQPRTAGAGGPAVVRAAADDDELMERALHSVRIEIRADAGARDSVHHITASGRAGEFDFTIRSNPSRENPATSGLTALSVARTLRRALTALDAG